MTSHAAFAAADLLRCGDTARNGSLEPVRTPVVEQADGGGVLGQEPAPLVKGPVAGDAQGAAFIGGRDHPEQQLRAGVIQRREPDLIDQDDVVAQQGVDHPADGIVRQAPVEGLGELGGGEVADLVPGRDGGGAEGDQQVALARARRYPRFRLVTAAFLQVISMLRLM